MISDTGEKSNKKAIQSQLIAFRADAETNRMLRLLEDKDKSKTEIILRAIKTSYNILLFENVIEEVKPLIKNIFSGAKILECHPFGYSTSKELDEEKVKLRYDETHVFFELPEFKKIQKKNIFSEADLMMKMSIKAMDLVELEFIKPIIFENIDRIDSSVLRKIYEVGAKKNLKIESDTIDKKRVRICLVLTGMIRCSGKKWSPLLEKDLKKMREALSELYSSEKEYASSENQTDDHSSDKQNTEVIGQQSSET